MTRVPRKGAQKFVYSSVYRCRQCQKTFGRRRGASLKVHAHAVCPNCGTERLKVLRRRDHIEKVYKGPFSILQGILGARLYHCVYCRLQFHDFRKLAKPDNGAAAGEPSNPTAVESAAAR